MNQPASAPPARWIGASRQTLYAALVLIGLPLILLAPFVFGGRVLFWGVPLMQFYGWERLAAEAWRMGEVPLWNPLVGNGAPLAANLQSAVFYPLNFLYLLLPAEHAMGYTAAWHVVLAGLFLFAYLRAIGLRPLPALIGAIAFQLSGYLIARLGFLSITATLPWVAAWLWRGERALQTGRLRESLWLALVIGLGLLAGHAQTALQGGLLLAAYTAYRLILVRRDGRPIGRRLVALGAGVALGCGLAAVQLLPAAELARESQRAGGLDFNFAMTHSYWPWRLLTLLAPDLFGNPSRGDFWGYDNYWENAAYVGLIPLALAALALRDWWRRRRTPDPPPDADVRLTPFFALAALVALLFALGWFTGIYPFLFRTVPGFSLFQGPARWLSAFTIAVCVLAGIGGQTLYRGRGDMRRSVKWIIVGLALVGAGIASRAFLSGRAATFPDATLRLGVIVAAAAVLFGIRPAAGDRRYGRWAALLVALVAIDLLSAHFALNPAIDPSLYHLPIRSAGAIGSDGGRVFTFDADEAAIRAQFGFQVPFPDFGPADVAYWMTFRETLIPNLAMIDGVASAGNFDSLLVGDYLRLWNTANAAPLDVALRLARLMHAGYVSSPRDLPLPVVVETPAAALYRLDQPLPRAWIVPAARVVSDTLAAVMDPAFDPLTEVVLDETSAGASPLGSPAGPSRHWTLLALHDTPNTFTIRAASEADGYLVLADTWYPGWRASLDGRPTEVLQANVAFRAVKFPAGEHTVEFRYAPDSAQVGAWVTGVSLVVLIAGGLLAARRRR